MKLGIFGSPFSHTDLASHHFEARKESQLVYFDDFLSLVRAVEDGRCEGGILPYHNSITGDIVEAHEAIRHFGVKIKEQKTKTIRHCLLGLQKSQLSAITRIVAHPQAWAQSQGKLERHLPGVVFEAGESSAHSAQHMIERGDIELACIGPQELADHLDLKVLLGDLAGKDNKTTFALIF